jgi:hypothetical protein
MQYDSKKKKEAIVLWLNGKMADFLDNGGLRDRHGVYLCNRTFIRVPLLTCSFVIADSIRI